MWRQYGPNRAQMPKNRAEKGREHPLGHDSSNEFAHGLRAGCAEDVPAAGLQSDGVGDVNNDNCVNVADMLTVRNRLGEGSGCP